ncbi:MAG: YihY/virulence factor BrkB family protein [Chloroflexi bacterium]|nr:YihY/virulence factor BrkB family protein [Chloroflexota bacterium]
MAAAISFYALLSLVPLAVATIFGLSFFLEPSSMQDMAQRAGQLAPVSERTISDVLTGTLNSRSVAGFAGIIGLLWAGTAVFSAIRKGVNATWGIAKPRPFFQERLIDISLMLGAATLMLVSIFSPAFLKGVLELITRETHVNGDLLWNRLASLISLTLSFIAFWGIYWFIPNTKVRLKEALPGAIAATIVFEVVTNMFVWYVHNYSTYTTVYGSVGSIVALLTWVYISAVILLFGSLITSRYAVYRSAKERALEDIVESVMIDPQPVSRR